MSFIQKNLRLIIICAIVAGGCFVLYKYYFSGSSSEPLTSASATPSVAGVDLLAELNQLQSVKLDDSIFSDPVFVSFTDFGSVIPPQPLGNSNPFRPLSRGGAGSLPSGIKSGTAK